MKSDVFQNKMGVGNNCFTISEYMFLPHSSTMMATGCLYDAVYALGSKYMELRRNLPDLMSSFVEINKVWIQILHNYSLAFDTRYFQFE